MITIAKVKTKLKFGGLRRKFRTVRRRFNKFITRPNKASMMRKKDQNFMSWTYNPLYNIPEIIDPHPMPSLTSISCESFTECLIVCSDKQDDPTNSNDNIMVIHMPSVSSLEYPETIFESRDTSLKSFSTFVPSASSTMSSHYRNRRQLARR